MALDDEVERLRRENQQLQEAVTKLELRVEELGLECEDLRQICASKSFSVGDALAARRHHRKFASARSKHPLGCMRTASEALSVLEISHSNFCKHEDPRGIADRRNPDGIRFSTPCVDA